MQRVSMLEMPESQVGADSGFKSFCRRGERRGAPGQRRRYPCKMTISMTGNVSRKLGLSRQKGRILRQKCQQIPDSRISTARSF